MRVLASYTIQTTTSPIDGHIFADVDGFTEPALNKLAEDIEAMLRNGGEPLAGKIVFRSVTPVLRESPGPLEVSGRVVALPERQPSAFPSETLIEGYLDVQHQTRGTLLREEVAAVRAFGQWLREGNSA